MPEKMNNISLLDCTFRDGGYYNNWDFSRELVRDYLQAMQTIEVDVVELGFRSFPVDSFKGPFFYTSDRLIESLDIDKSIKLSVMINASELIVENESSVERVKQLFSDKSRQLIYMVRIACHFHEVEKIIDTIEWLKSEGYFVGINLMQIGGKPEDEISRLVHIISTTNADVLYFADSLGSLEPDDVSNIYDLISNSWKKDIGIHTHDNMGNAISNTLKAIDEGICWVDSTITGMGRGPGNAQTEYLILEIAEIRERDVNISSVLKLIDTHFKEMQFSFGWGKNPLYYLAGKFKIHPMYVQRMLSDKKYDEEDILSLLEYLKEVGASKFDTSLLDQDWDENWMSTEGKYSPKNDFLNEDVLIIAGGNSVSHYKDDLEEFILKNNLKVVCLNTQMPVSEDLINFRVACHPIRIASDRLKYSASKIPIIIPKGRLDKKIVKHFKEISLLDFGMSIQKDVFRFGDKSCIVPSRLVLCYCLAAITSGKASQIFFAGFDGYGSGDARNIKVQSLLNLYSNTKEILKITSLTPTSYDIPLTSIF